MRALATAAAVLLVGVGLLAGGWVLVDRGPFTPQLGPRPDRWPANLALAALLNRTARRADPELTREVPRAVVSSERPGATGLSQLNFALGQGKRLECSVAANSPAEALRRYLGFVREGELHEHCASYDGSEIAVYEVNGDSRAVCPGQYASLSDQQLHHALFHPALAQASALHETTVGTSPGPPHARLDQGAAALSVLEPPPEGDFASWQCSGDRKVNCAVTATLPVIYCGRIRPGAAFLLQSGQRRPVRPGDVAASLYYYRALSAVRDPGALTQLNCGSLTSSVYAHALVSEVITSDTWEDYLDAFFARSPLAADSIAMPELVEGRRQRRLWLRDRLSRAFQDHRAVCFEVPRTQLVQGDREGKLERTIRLALAFPVFAPFDSRDETLVSPLLTLVHQVATPQQQPPRSPLGQELYRAFAFNWDTGAPEPATWQRMRRQLVGVLGDLKLPEEYDKEKGFVHIAGSGDFRVSRFSRGTGYTLEGYGRGATQGIRRTLKFGFLWEDQLPERIGECRKTSGVCFFRGVLGRSEHLAGPGVQSARPVRGEYVSMLGLFARRHKPGPDLRCRRRALQVLATAERPDLLAAIYDVLGEGAQPRQGWPTQWRQFGLLPASLATSRYPTVKLGTHKPSQVCRVPLSLAYVKEQPFAPIAKAIQRLLQEEGFAVDLKPMPAAEVYRHSPSEYSWDLVLAVASYYTNRNLRTLLSLLRAGSRNNLSQGEVLGTRVPQAGAAATGSHPDGTSERASSDFCVGMRYEATLVDPVPPWMHLATDCATSQRPDSLAALHKLEARVHAGRAPMLPLFYFEPAALKMPANVPLSPNDPHLYSRLLRQSTKQARARADRRAQVEGQR